MLSYQDNGGHPDRLRIGHPLPDFTLPDLDGHPVRFSEFARDHVTVLSIWRERCSDCLPSFAVGNDLAAEFDARPGVRFLNVAYEGRQPGTGAWVKEAGIRNGVLLDAQGKVVDVYGISTYTVYITDASGNLLYQGPVQKARSLLAELLPSSESIPEERDGSRAGAEAAATRTIRIREGECLWTIARRELGRGARWPEIARENDLSRPRLIHAGQRLIIPDSEAVASSK